MTNIEPEAVHYRARYGGEAKRNDAPANRHRKAGVKLGYAHEVCLTSSYTRISAPQQTNAMCRLRTLARLLVQ